MIEEEERSKAIRAPSVSQTHQDHSLLITRKLEQAAKTAKKKGSKGREREREREERETERETEREIGLMGLYLAVSSSSGMVQPSTLQNQT